LEPTRELIDDIYRQKVLRARAMPPEEKLFAGIRLFEYACSLSRDGIRHQFPDADEAHVEQILEQRLALRKRMEESQWKSKRPS
jgi:hypothetical protein